jgi:hypothetical protein
MPGKDDRQVRLRYAMRVAGYVTAVLLVLFGAWWASFAGFLMPTQMHLYVTFNYWQGIGLSVLGAVNFASVLRLRRPYAWVAPAISGGGLLALQAARIAVFGESYLNTDWWVTVGAVVTGGLFALFAVLTREEKRPRS